MEAALTEGLYAYMHTSKGLIVLFLEHEKTPCTVANFVGLAEGVLSNKARSAGMPYFDGTIFHRVIPSFMIQGGDPSGTGRGGPGYQFADEIGRGLKHNAIGILSMANAGPNTNGSQFFITLAASPLLNYRHTVFGHVVEGKNVLKAIQQGDQIEVLKIVRHGASVEHYDPLNAGLVQERLGWNSTE